MRVFVKPGSQNDSVIHNPDASLTVTVRASPTEGKANYAVITVLADFLRIPKSKIRLVRGHKSRWKLFEIQD
ncbi:MAG: DUF167 domain-containing protein [bacterium]